MARRVGFSTGWVFAAGLIAWLANAVIQWASAPPLGYNEALYARATQLVLDGEQLPWNYLSKGMTAIAAPGFLAGASDRALRFVPLLIGIAFVLAGVLLARRVMGSAVAAWLAGIIAGTWSIARRSAELLSDLPAAACLLAGLAILITELERDDGPRWRVILVAPLFAAALYVRYGSCLPIGIIGVVALGFGWRTVVRRPAPVIATVVLFVVLLVPHALDAMHTTGSPLGFLLDGKDVVRKYRGAGLLGFVATNPFSYYGLVTTPLVILGLLSIIRPRDRRAVMLWLIGVGDIVAIGMTTYAQSRYIFLGLTLLLVLGTDVAYRWITTRPPRLRKTLGYAAVGAIAASWISVVVLSSLTAARSERWQGMLSAAAVIKRDAAGARCQVAARNSTQIGWYSGCQAAIGVPDARGDEIVYFVRDDFGDAQLDPGGLPGHPRTLLDRPEALVLRLDP